MNIKDLQALTLVGPTRENHVLDPFAVQHLDISSMKLRRLKMNTGKRAPDTLC